MRLAPAALALAATMVASGCAMNATTPTPARPPAYVTTLPEMSPSWVHPSPEMGDAVLVAQNGWFSPGTDTTATDRACFMLNATNATRLSVLDFYLTTASRVVKGSLVNWAVINATTWEVENYTDPGKIGSLSIDPRIGHENTTLPAGSHATFTVFFDGTREDDPPLSVEWGPATFSLTAAQPQRLPRPC